MFDGPSLVFSAAGLAVFLAAVLPKVLRNVPVSMPMVFLGAGILAFSLLKDLPDPDPVRYGEFTTHLTEVCVIISLMGAGLALDRPLGWRRWSTTWRMLGIAMPLSLLGLTLLNLWVLGVGLAAAILLAAALAPTDPVLASEVQVGEPADDEEEDSEGEAEDEVRFGLTSEAGLNDGLAFPFVYLAIGMSLVGTAPSDWFPHWIAVDVFWRIGMGVLLGFLTGKVLSRLFFSAPLESIRLSNHSEGFVALAATFLAYGVTEMLDGYGFVAVFVCAVTIRTAERTHGYHRVLHSYVEQLERLLTVVLLLLLGGAIARGLLSGVGWREVVVAAAFLLVVRPLAGWLGLLGGKPGPRERMAIAFFGVRGIGSLYYLGYALGKGHFDGAEQLWGLLGLVVASSIVLHGITAAPLINRLDRIRKKTAVERFGEERPDTAV
ncbi:MULTISPECIES: cation:proton antiporter [unclassified Arthrobacter]|uniref:cation:proton antiporter n=1 Tax=unclassified Arthrobacter TaxID=235627 RepID=UPI0024DF7747|nr:MULTISPECIES: cation:proton antiporter [unclassified Arthrobacter]MCC9145275.1 cation:proton antiporter [Arthrobacter sp. zg-Y919]MDK1276503.1 cation:proton antiporter [Arthrobacter sp. zg.Y919]WIB01902.1 cation:proton antiporter [Arthrobacter sp. zg-Y919]